MWVGVKEPLYPLTFRPIFKERVWGGRSLETLFGKSLPVGKRVGESWEIADRPGDVSVAAAGPLSGRSLRGLLEERGAEIMGRSRLQAGRFPLLVKILDARQKLSLQVHPPAGVARMLGGEPKTEMWFMADCRPGADLFVGLKVGVSRRFFEEKIRLGTVAECFHRVSVKRGDGMFLPSGRVHAIGAGNVIFEIQQNSDTTYRVFDWDRVGLDGKPRELHVVSSLESIDFADWEPALVKSHPRVIAEGVSGRALADCDWFRAEHLVFEAGARLRWPAGEVARVVGVAAGRLFCEGNGVRLCLGAGDFGLLPASVEVTAAAESESCESLIVAVL